MQLWTKSGKVIKLVLRALLFEFTLDVSLLDFLSGTKNQQKLVLSLSNGSTTFSPKIPINYRSTPLK